MQAFRARYVFPVVQPPIRGGMVSLDDDGTAVVGNNLGDQPPLDLGNVAIVPSLVNAHAHLELSHFSEPIGDPAQGFPAWIRSVVAWRKEQAQRFSPTELAQQRQEAIARGAAESAASGVGLVADIASAGDEVVESSACQRFVFREVLGLHASRADQLVAEATAFVQHRGNPRGLSPHAPYTVGIELLTRLAAMSTSQKFPLAMHLAESPDELELLASHSGDFYTLLNELSAWDPSALPRGIAIADYLQVLATAYRVLVIHGNYLTAEDIELLVKNRERMTVVYCPRTHAYFGHPRYPLVELLHRGVDMAIGTDSRASSPDLNLWDDLRLIADSFPELSLERILQLGTLDGARALFGPEAAVPNLFQIIELPDEDPQDPHELLFDSRARVRGFLSPVTTA